MQTESFSPSPSTRRDLALLGLAVVAALLPFAGKPVHIDDALFLWTARQIQAHPFDPYGFSINWDNWDTPAHWIILNPPLASYYLAAVTAVAGWSEPVLHAAFLVWGVLAAWGVYFLSRRFCRDPFVAALAAVFTPVFLLSASTLMCDVMLLAFWCWSLEFWLAGLERRSLWLVLAAGLLAALAALTKYFGLSLLPLFVLLGVSGKGSRGLAAMGLLLPCAIIAAYVLLTYRAYDHNLLLGAASYSKRLRSLYGREGLESGWVGVMFTGGCLFTVAVYALWCGPRRWIVITAAALLVGAIAGWLCGAFGRVTVQDDTGLRWSFLSQLLMFTLSGALILALAIEELLRRRDTGGWLLGLWTLGTFVFASFLNWSNNGRSILPLVPAGAILVMRRLERGTECKIPQHFWPRLLPLVPGLLIALAALWADHQWAQSARDAAREISARYNSPGKRLWFQGHWGFQYYLESLGGRPVEVRTTAFEPGDVVVLPERNYGSGQPPLLQMRPIDNVEVPVCGWFATMHGSVGAGFYTSQWGPLPFAAGPVPPDCYQVFRVSEKSTFTP